MQSKREIETFDFFTRPITKIESLRFLGRGLSSTLLFDFSNFGSGYQRLWLAGVPPSNEAIVDNLDLGIWIEYYLPAVKEHR